MNPNNFKRNYKFRSDQSKTNRYLNWVIIITMLILFVLWYFLM